MLVQRLLVSLILIPIGMWFIAQGGLLFSLLVTLILALAAWEYADLFRAGELHPGRILVVLAVMALVMGRHLTQFSSTPWMISAIVLVTMTYHLVAYESGRSQAGTEFAVAIGGIFYIGWLGAYLVTLRALPDGQWWFLLVLPAVWFADAGAYFIGKRFGRHPMSPRLSPKKTWEGYLGGLLTGTVGAILLAGLWGAAAGPESGITLIHGALLGIILAALTPLGDLGESMLKRQVGVKDSSNLLPGHGGVLDRIDSWLWAGVMGYYLISWFFI